MSGDMMPKSRPEPELPGRRSRAERDRLRAAYLRVELDRIAAVGDAQVEIIQAAGRAQLHADRSRYTARLAGEVGEHFVEIDREIGRLLDREPPDQVLMIGLAQIEAVGLDVLKSHLEDHRRDGRDRFGR